MERSERPLPAALMMPWLADNKEFQRELLARDSQLQNLAPVRKQIESQIRTAESMEPCALGAVDAAWKRKKPRGFRLMSLRE